MPTIQGHDNLLLKILEQQHRHEQRVEDLLKSHAKEAAEALEQALRRAAGAEQAGPQRDTEPLRQAARQLSGLRSPPKAEAIPEAKHIKFETPAINGRDEQVDRNSPPVKVSGLRFRSEVEIEDVDQDDEDNEPTYVWDAPGDASEDRLKRFESHNSATRPLGRQTAARETAAWVKRETTDSAGVLHGDYEAHKERLCGKTNGRNLVSIKMEQLKAGAMLTKNWEDNRPLLQRIISSQKFEALIAALIFANSLTMGFQADWNVKHLSDSAEPAYVKPLEAVFTLLFCIELGIRVLAEKSTFLSQHNANLGWNVFDCVIVFLGVLNTFYDLVGGDGASITYARLFRIIRVARVVRVMRVMRFFSDLRVMIAGISQSIKSLGWAILLLGLIWYMVAVCVMQVIYEEVGPEYRKNQAVTQDQATVIHQFGSMEASVLTLYMAISGGQDWGDIVYPLISVSWAIGVFFSLYVAFAVLCVLNIITGVFVENTNKLTAYDDSFTIVEHLEEKKRWLQGATDLFKQSSNSSAMTLHDFEHVAGNPTGQAYFRKLGLYVDEMNVKGLFALLDFDGDGYVEMDEFVLGIQQLHGSARSIDLARLQHDAKKMKKTMNQVLDIASFTFERLDEFLNPNGNKWSAPPRKNTTQEAWKSPEFGSTVA